MIAPGPRFSTALILLFALSGVAAQQKKDKSTTEQQAQPSQPAVEKVSTQSASPDSSYVIGPEDVLDVSVWKEPDFSLTVPVRPDGKISVPLINDVQAGGKTPLELAATITDLLKKYLTAPRVTVVVKAINSRRVYIMGEVVRPGTIPLMGSMTVLQALSSAGGFTQFAKVKKVYLLRKEGNKQNAIPFNYNAAIKGATDQNFALQPGDTIVVP